MNLQAPEDDLNREEYDILERKIAGDCGKRISENIKRKDGAAEQIDALIERDIHAPNLSNDERERTN